MRKRSKYFTSSFLLTLKASKMTIAISTMHSLIFWEFNYSKKNEKLPNLFYNLYLNNLLFFVLFLKILNGFTIKLNKAIEFKKLTQNIYDLLKKFPPVFYSNFSSSSQSAFFFTNFHVRKPHKGNPVCGQYFEGSWS